MDARQQDWLTVTGSSARALDYDFHAATVIADPYPVYAHMRRTDPIWRNPISGTWTLMRYADIDEALRGPTFSNERLEVLFDRLDPEVRRAAEPLRPILEPRLLFTEGERHRRIRALAMHGFTKGRFTTYATLVQGLVDRLLDGLPLGEPVDFQSAVADRLPGLVILEILGLPPAEQDALKAWTDDVYRWIGHAPGSLAERTAAAVAAMAGIREVLNHAISRAREMPRDDMLSALVHARQEGELLDDFELVANVVGLINAGQETTSCLMSNGLFRLMQFPAQLERVQADPGLVPAAIEEMLRYDAPAQFIARVVAEPTVVGGVKLATGDTVALGLASGNRDEASWDEPDVFDVGRNPNRHLSFGHGPHFCIGNQLARMETAILLRSLLDRFGTILPAYDSPRDVQWRPTLSFRAPVALPLVLRV